MTACATPSTRGRAHDARSVNVPGAACGAPPSGDVLLDVRNLRTYFHVMDGDRARPSTACRFSLGRGKTLGIVGESGSGKSVTALTIMRLLDIPPAEIVDGRGLVRRAARSCACRSSEMRKLRGNDMAMIFQEPLTSLNPVFTIGDQIAEQVELHKKVKQEGGLGPGDRIAPAGRHPAARSGGSSSTPTRCPAACASA